MAHVPSDNLDRSAADDLAAASGAKTGGWREVRFQGTAEPGARQFIRRLDVGHLNVVVGQSRQCGWHLSISHRLDVADAQGRQAPGRLPTWDEIREARYRFCPDDVTMAMVLPPTAEYVNIYETGLHLWQIPNDTGTT